MSVIMVGVTFALLFAVLLGAAYSGFVAVLRRAVAHSVARKLLRVPAGAYLDRLGERAPTMPATMIQE